MRLVALSLPFSEVPRPGAAAVCAACGPVWAERDAAALRQKLYDPGNGDVWRRRGLLEDD